MDTTKLRDKYEELKKKVKEAIGKAVEKAKELIGMVIEFAKQYPLEFAAILVTAAGGGMKLINRHDRNKAIKADEKKRLRQIYDRSEGHYWTLNRTPKPEEWGEINYRHKQGEGYYYILKDMGLI